MWVLLKTVGKNTKTLSDELVQTEAHTGIQEGRQ